MKQWTLRLGLSLMVVVSVWTTRLPAQDVLVVPAAPYEPAQSPPHSAAIIAPRTTPYKRVLNHFNFACQADPWATTGTFCSEFRWVFGSSRSFFDEPCVPGQRCGDRRMQR